MIIGARIPKEYVVVTGAGQTSFGPGVDPWETAAYDLALLDAGIENCNIVEYTSVLPHDAVEISLDDAVAQGYLHHGMVLECIKAQINGNQGEHICAGVGRCEVWDEDDNLIGGFAAEYEGYGSQKLAADKLTQALDGIFERRYAGKGYRMGSIKIVTRDLVVDEDYGTVLVALGFVRFTVLDYDA